MPWRPQYPGEVPTLGWYAIDWMTANLAVPEKPDYEPFVPLREQEEFLLRWYQLDPITGKRIKHRGLLQRPRGWGKSPFAGAIAALEALGDIVPDGWDANGRPVGRPWSSLTRPLVWLSAVSEDQAAYTWDPLMDMLRESAPVYDNYVYDLMETFIALPARGRIERRTSSATTAKGGRPIFVVADQTEEWTESNGGVRLAKTLHNNITKTGGSFLETPNAVTRGSHSVAETSIEWARKILAGQLPAAKILIDIRQPQPVEDWSDREQAREAVRYAYGDAANDPRGCTIHDDPCPPGWADVDRVLDRLYESDLDPETAMADFLNIEAPDSDAWLDPADLKIIARPHHTVPDGEPIVLGFDGSRGRARGKADATALIGCTLEDGHLFELGIWEPGVGQTDFAMLTAEADAAVVDAFSRFAVVGFYADPSGWAEHVASWEQRFGSKLRVKAGATPIAHWPKGKDSRVIEYVARLETAVQNREVTYDGSVQFTRHLENARRRQTRGGYLLYKEFPDSVEKVDAAYAAVIAWKARLDAIAKNAKPRSTVAYY